jgi:ribosomal subunit interface protein
MNVQIKCRGMECPDTVRDQVYEKMQRFERVIPETAFIEIELATLTKSMPEGDQEAEIIVDIPGVKPVIRFTSHGQTLIEAIDRVLDKLDEEMSDRKDRDHDYHYNGPSPKERIAEQMRSSDAREY